MPRRVPLCAVTWALAAGCYDLPDIEPDVCGNKVVDGEEDCDGFTEYGEGTLCGAPELEDESKQCVYLCGAEGALCPPGWGCGLDGVCNRPEGTFVDAPASPWFMPVDEFAIGDVDGDRAADLIGNDPAQIIVRFGSANAEFPDELATAIRRPTGAVTYTDLDRDERLDAIVPIDLGLFVLRGGGGRTLDSVAYSPFSSGGSIVEFHRIDHPSFPGPDILVVDLVENQMGFLDQDADELEGIPIQPPAPDAYGLVLPPPVAEVNGTPLRPEFALTYYNDDKVHIYTSAGLPGGPDGGSTLTPELFQTVSLPGTWRVAQGAMFAQVDGAFGPDLLISAVRPADEGQQIMGILVAFNNGGNPASFDPPVPVPRLDIFAIPEFGMNLPLASDDFDGDGLGDFVTMFGVFLASEPGGAGNPPGAYEIFATSLPDLWSDAAIGDFNGDDKPDVAVARFDAQNQRVLSGVDLFLAGDGGLFNPFHVQTEGGGPRFYPRSLATGDFDGDLIDDVAFLQEVPLAEIPEGRLMVGFGAADGRFADAALMGRFAGTPQMTTSQVTLSPNSLDDIDDLFVTSYDPVVAPSGGSSISVMFGDSSRRMVAPLILDTSLVEGGPPTNPQQPRRALIGDFNQDDINDFLVLAEDSLYGDNGAHRFVWYVPGAGTEGQVDPSSAVYTDMFTSDAVGDFNFGCSTWEVVDLEEGGTVRTPDELIGLDDSAACAFRDDAEFDPDPEMMVVKVDPGSAEPMRMSKVAFGGELSFPSQLSAADFDDDGDQDPVVLFHGSYVLEDGADYGLAGQGIGILWNDGAKVGGDDGVIGEGEYAAIPLPVGVQPLKVAALGINEDQHKDLLVLTDVGVYMALREPSDERTFQPPILIEERYEGRLLGAGDVNGDGLTDFAVVHGENVTVKLAVRAPRKGKQ
ncbi:MAG TPA: VCBS repeat-containing protein [Kofleriaceae bacterium]|nr:VCBS repeat-containing protein [Kofleriaceae bacterium]